MSESRGPDADTRPRSGGAPRPGGRGQAPGPAPGRQGGRSSPRWGALPWGRGIVLVFAGALVGGVVSVLAGGQPGLLLGILVIAGTAAATLAVEPRAVYKIIPAPALAYLVAASLAGLINDRAIDTSRTALAISAAQWVAGGFYTMSVATGLAVVMTAVRWQLGRRGY